MPAKQNDHSQARIKRRNDSGQALVEFALSAVLMLMVVFAIIDFSRALHDLQIITNLTGEGSAMASRGITLTDTAAAVVAASSPLNLGASTNGKVIVSAVYSDTTKLTLTGQASQGGLTASSNVGTTINGTATLPSNAIPPVGQTVYVTEVYYSYKSITLMGKLLTSLVLPSKLYNVAYY
jgi:Flp pilus assembly protein TadG